jgi:hypothetical protein
MTLKCRIFDGKSHTTVTIWAGADKDHLAYCGDIHFLAAEGEAFIRLLRQAPPFPEVLFEEHPK